MSQIVSFFKKSGREVSFKKQDLIFREGDKSDSAFYIKKGKVEIFTKKYEDRKVLAVLKEGEMVGEMSLFEDSPRSASGRAIEDSILLEVSKNKFHAFLQKEPKKAFIFTREIVEIISQRLRIANNYLASLFSFSLSALRLKKVEDLAVLILDKIISNISGINKCLLYIWNQFNEKFEYLQGQGEISDEKELTFPRYDESEIVRMLNGNPSFVAPIGEDKILGFLYISKKESFKEEEKVLLQTMLHLSFSLILDIWQQEEEENLKRLKKVTPSSTSL